MNPLSHLGPLYHNYSLFGIHNEQIPGIYTLNQRSKEKILRAYIAYAIAKSCSSTDTSVSFAEMFCADGYYAMLARHFGATISYGIDNNRDGHLNQAVEIARVLELTNIQFIQLDVNALHTLPAVDIVANIGGLYHVENPVAILEKSYLYAKKYLIVQSVVSLATADEQYFASPAPGWTWGSRFSKESFSKMIYSRNWNIVDEHFNELEGNGRLEDRGSVYYLIKK